MKAKTIMVSNLLKVILITVLLALLTGVHNCYAAFTLGVATHFAQGKGELDRDLLLAQAAGVVSIRDEAYWNQVEKKKGHFNLLDKYRIYVNKANSTGLKPLIVLSYGNQHYDNKRKPKSKEAIEAFSNYCAFIAKQFKGKVYGYEVWNEWAGNVGKTEPGDPSSYIKLAAPCIAKIRKEDDKAIILVGSVTSNGMENGWLKQFIRIRGDKLGDGVSLHTYIHCRGNASPEMWYLRLKSVLKMIKAEAEERTVPTYVTEMGWPTNFGKCGRSEETGAAFLERTLLLTRALPEMKGIWWYELLDKGQDRWNRKHNYGVLDYDGNPKKTYNALNSISDFIKRGQFVEKVDAGIEGTWILKFMLDEKILYAAWSEKESMACNSLHIDGETIYLKLGSRPVIGMLQDLKNMYSCEHLKNS